LTEERVLKERFPPYFGSEWEKKINDPSHPNFWRYGVANLVFCDSVGGRNVVLDVGCGTGGSTCFLAEELPYGPDCWCRHCEKMVQVAKEKVREKDSRSMIEFVVCDGRQLPFRDSSFEALVSRGDIFPWLIPQEKTLREFGRVMASEAIIMMETGNGALMKVNTTSYYFERTHDGKIAYVVCEIDASRDHLVTSYVLGTTSDIARKISQNPEFIRTGWCTGDEYSLEDIKRETVEVRQGLTTHWHTANEFRDLFKTCDFEEIEVTGDGLLMKLLAEGNQGKYQCMKERPELFFEVEKRLIPYLNPDKTPTILVKASRMKEDPEKPHQARD